MLVLLHSLMLSALALFQFVYPGTADSTNDFASSDGSAVPLMQQTSLPASEQPNTYPVAPSQLRSQTQGVWNTRKRIIHLQYFISGIYTCVGAFILYHIHKYQNCRNGIYLIIRLSDCKRSTLAYIHNESSCCRVESDW